MPKRKLTSLKLTHISAVTRPCQEGALALIMKARPDDPSEAAQAVAKYFIEGDEARSFADVLREREFDQAIWPMVDALSGSIRSIMVDKSLNSEARQEKITQSVDEFLSAVRLKANGPALAKEFESALAELFKGDRTMPKTVEQLEKEVADLTGQMTSAKAQITALTAERDAATAKATAAEEARTKTEAELATTKTELVKATDEEIEVGGAKVLKSAVGEAQFTMVKALRDERDEARFEKQAETEFAHVPGTAVEKAKVLKAVAAMPEEARKPFEAIMGAAEKMAKAGFDRIGVTAADRPAEVQKAIDDFDAKVAEVQARDKCGKTAALQKARIENPELFTAYREGLEGQSAAN